MLRFQYLYAMLQIISKAAKFQEKETPCSAYNAAYFPKFLPMPTCYDGYVHNHGQGEVTIE